MVSDEQYFGDVVNVKCDCCGKMIQGKPLSRVAGGKKLRLCDKECYKLYLEYRLKKKT